LLFHARRLLADADAILACNAKEAALLKARHPGRRILVHPHGVPLEPYEKDCRPVAREAFPAIQGKSVLLCVGRVDPVKNQAWLIERAPAIFLKHPRTLLVLAGACTDAAYGESIARQIDRLGLREQVILTGGLPPGDPRLIGLLQEAKVVLLPSISETFGLVILEAWAAGTAVISSMTSGASALVEHRTNGWLFHLESPKQFFDALDEALGQPELAAELAAAGKSLVASQYDTRVLAGRMKALYEELIEEKNALRNLAR
jgi:glycosyltransferase involved in cell wall biosynthesis